MATKQRWKLLHHVYGQHKFYLDTKNDRIAVADDSVEPGGTPDEQDDGLIYLATYEPILITVDDTPDNEDAGLNYHAPMITIPVEQPDGDGGYERCGHVLSDPDEWLWIAATFKMPVKQVFETGRLGFTYNVSLPEAADA